MSVFIFLITMMIQQNEKNEKLPFIEKFRKSDFILTLMVHLLKCKKLWHLFSFIRFNVYEWMEKNPSKWFQMKWKASIFFCQVVVIGLGQIDEIIKAKRRPKNNSYLKIFIGIIIIIKCFKREKKERNVKKRRVRKKNYWATNTHIKYWTGKLRYTVENNIKLEREKNDRQNENFIFIFIFILFLFFILTSQ